MELLLSQFVMSFKNTDLNDFKDPYCLIIMKGFASCRWPDTLKRGHKVYFII